MEVIPALDLIDGKVVRLRQGKYDAVSHYQASALDLAQSYQQAGASSLHLVDLDAAKTAMGESGAQGTPSGQAITALAQSLDLRVQMGGGIRSVDDIQRTLDSGVDRVVVGSLAVTQPDNLPAMVERFGCEALVVAVDLTSAMEADGSLSMRVAYRGWQEVGPEVGQFVHVCVAAGVKHMLCTDISRDGMLQGPNVELYRHLSQRFTEVSWIASGGVSCAADIPALRATGAQAVVIGRALLEGKLSAAEALSC